MRVALVVMPFASANRPSLAAGLLKAELEERGIACDVHYLSLEFARRLGFDRYQLMAEGVATTVLAGDWVFSQSLHGDGASGWETYEREVLRHPVWGMREECMSEVQDVARMVPGFLSHALSAVDWGRYDLIGFSSVFSQTLASLSLAQKIRRSHPSVLLAAGGPNFHSPMGRAYMEFFPFLDFVATGEGDIAFPSLCETLRDGGREVPRGILYREGGRVMPAEDVLPELAALDSLPAPDFSEFFTVFERTFPELRPNVLLSIEASRGCWWGDVSHCSFCGLNGETMTYRRKSGEKVAAEVAEHVRQHPDVQLMFADNILDKRAFEDLLPRWVASNERTPKFFEVKPNLSRFQLAMLADAGVIDVQAGIEALSDGSLRQMEKGVTAAQNVAFLRWSEEFGIVARWNLIHGSPNEQVSDHDAAFDLARKIGHLRPPAACAQLRLDRHSPNHRNWRERGFSRVRPLTAYEHLHPFEEDDLERIASVFDYEVERTAGLRAALQRLLAFVADWRAHEHERDRATLAVRRHLDGGWDLVDRRFNRPATISRLDPIHLAFLLACDAPTKPDRARERVLRAFPEASPKRHEEALAFLVASEAIAAAGSFLVTLALLPFDLEAGGLSRYQSERTVFHANARASIRIGR